MGAGKKIGFITNNKISTSERSALAREAWDHFTTTFSEKSLGMTSITKVGKSKVLNAYVEVDLTRYSSFMSNVKGCGSLANKRQLNSWKIITEEEHNKILSGTRKVATAFMGYEEKEIPLTINR